MMQPIRIKVYGFIRMTRQTYLILQAVGLVIALAMMAVGAAAMLWAGTILPQLPADDSKLDRDIDALDVAARVLIFLFWFSVLILIGESLETYLVLRRFARAEADQQATLAALDVVETAPSIPTSTAVQLPSDERSNTNIQP